MIFVSTTKYNSREKPILFDLFFVNLYLFMKRCSANTIHPKCSYRNSARISTKAYWVFLYLARCIQNNL